MGVRNTPKIALVTGAGSGIGRAVSLALQAAGYSVALAGRRAGELKRTASLARPSGGEMLAIPTDVSNSDSVRSLFGMVVKAFGRLDVLFNNAAQQAIRLMKAQNPRGGRIVNNGSISAHTPRPNSVPYTMTKHAITGLTKCICLDGRAFDIACGQIDIGNAATEMTERMTTGAVQPDGSKVAEPRMDAVDVAEAVLYMANLPLETNVPFMIVMATGMPFAGRG